MSGDLRWSVLFMRIVILCTCFFFFRFDNFSGECFGLYVSSFLFLFAVLFVLLLLQDYFKSNADINHFGFCDNL